MSQSASKRKPVSRFNDLTFQRFNDFSAEICILAGGLSKRMGRDKSRLRLGATTMLGHIRKAARATGLPVRVIRRDCVPKCGPLGGIYTALKSTKAEAALFLACDMPLVSTELIRFILEAAGKGMESRLQPASRPHFRQALFVRSRGCAGFPFILASAAIGIVHHQIQVGNYSLQGLAAAVGGTILPLKHGFSRQLFNVNTPKDLITIRKKSVGPNVKAPKPRLGNGHLPPYRK